MFLLDPFEGPAVPMQGTYAVVYLDGRGLPLGGRAFRSPWSKSTGDFC